MFREDWAFPKRIKRLLLLLLFPTPICPQARRSLYCYLRRKPYRKGRIKTSDFLSEPTVYQTIIQFPLLKKYHFSGSIFGYPFCPTTWEFTRPIPANQHPDPQSHASHALRQALGPGI
jgi:hypothetical protein